MPLILILDDRATNRAIFTRLAGLIADDVVVESFGNPLDALEWLESNAVDLVITDYSMPEMDGAEFTRRFRGLRSGASAPVLVVTAHNDRSFRQAAMEAGATDFSAVEFVTNDDETRATRALLADVATNG